MSYIRMAKLFVPSGGFVQASCGDTFWPGHAQISVDPGLHGRFGSSAPNLNGMRAPSAMDFEVSVKYEAARASEMVAIIATPRARLSMRIFSLLLARSLPRPSRAAIRVA